MTRTGLDELQSLLGAELQGCAVPGFGRGLWDFCKEEHPFRRGRPKKESVSRLRR